MTTFLVIVILVIVALVIYLATLDGDYHIDRALIIHAPINDVYKTVVNFKSWPKWSPWLLHEPETNLKYSDNYDQAGGFYTWDGKLVGAGKLVHLKLHTNESIQQRIEFLKPFKSICSVGWSFKNINGQTEVHWSMKGKMPFLFRFMTKMTTSMISKDYDLGLRLLNGYMNTDNSHPRFKFCGSEKLQSFDYIYRPFKGYKPQLIASMQEDLVDLVNTAKGKGVTQGLPLTIYHKVDLKKLYFECERAIPVSSSANDIGLSVKTLMAGKYYKVECMGEYQFLELGWYKAQSHVKMLKLKADKSRPSLEVYETNPQEVQHVNNIRTSLYLPIK